MSVQLLGKRELKRLASVANDGAGTGYSGFAKGMMAKMGWAEGQGLGKDMQGRSTYVQVKKKDDNAGLGKEKAQQNNVNDQWYFNAFDSALANMGGKKKKKKKDKKKRKKDNAGEDEQSAEEGEGCMYDKMFKATGGARMGMRARASQNGKLARTEGGKDGADAAAPTPAIQEAQSSGSHKRKRAADTGGSAAAQTPAGAAGVVVKQEKAASDANTAVVKREEGDKESEGPRASTKAERKRERSEAKKAKKAGKEKEAKEEKAAKAPPGGEGSGEARSSEAEKASKKKKKKKKTNRGENEA